MCFPAARIINWRSRAGFLCLSPCWVCLKLQHSSSCAELNLLLVCWIFRRSAHLPAFCHLVFAGASQFSTFVSVAAPTLVWWTSCVGVDRRSAGQGLSWRFFSSSRFSRVVSSDFSDAATSSCLHARLCVIRFGFDWWKAVIVNHSGWNYRCYPIDCDRNLRLNHPRNSPCHSILSMML